MAESLCALPSYCQLSILRVTGHRMPTPCPPHPRIRAPPVPSALPWPWFDECHSSFGRLFPLFFASLFSTSFWDRFFAIFGDLGTKNEVKMVKNLLKIEQNSPKIAKMSENAKVHLDLCFTYPNGSPHDQESTKIGREGSKIHENMLKKRMRQKVTTKSCFSSILGSFWGPK